MSAAYESTLHVSFDVRAGLVMRQIHHWAALLFIGSILVHMLRIFFTGAFRKPRELNWMVGLTLFLLALGNGFTGYSLPDDLLSGTGLRIAYSVLLSIPLLGPWAAFLVFGGEFPSDDIIPRLFVIHVLIVPAADRRPAHRSTSRCSCARSTRSSPGKGRTETQRRRLEALADLHREDPRPLLLRLRGVRGASAGSRRSTRSGSTARSNPSAVSAGSQPDWYIGWLEGALRLMPPWELRLGGFEIPNPFFPGVLLPGHHVHDPLPLAVHRGALHQGPRRAQPPRPAARPSGPHVHRRGGARVLLRALPRGWQRRDRRALRPLGQRGHLRVPSAAVRVPRGRRLRLVPALQGAPRARPAPTTRSSRSSNAPRTAATSTPTRTAQPVVLASLVRLGT